MKFSNKKLTLEGNFELGDYSLNVDEVLDFFTPLLTEERIQKINQVASQRTYHVAPVIEHPYDKGNVRAVMRSAEAYGYINFNIVEQPNNQSKESLRVSRGTEKWLNTTKHKNTLDCVMSLKQQGYQILVTHLEASKPIEQCDFTKPTAVVFGNERDGVSPEMLEHCDGRFILPMHGFAQSFNISVAAAITFSYINFKMGEKLPLLTPEQAKFVQANYILRCIERPEKILKAKKYSSVL